MIVGSLTDQHLPLFRHHLKRRFLRPPTTSIVVDNGNGKGNVDLETHSCEAIEAALNAFELVVVVVVDSCGVAVLPINPVESFFAHYWRIIHPGPAFPSPVVDAREVANTMGDEGADDALSSPRRARRATLDGAKATM
ncbi:hypothetical protein TSMEX_003524 [Taenia solium]